MSSLNEATTLNTIATKVEISVDDLIKLEDGVSKLRDQNDNALAGRADEDVMIGGQGADEFHSGLGNEGLPGGDEEELFNDGDDNNKITDLELGIDRIDLWDFGFMDADTVTAVGNNIRGTNAAGSDAEIDLDIDDSVILLGVKHNDLSSHPESYLFS